MHPGRSIEAAVMIQVVDAHLETSGFKPLTDFDRIVVGALGYEIEGGAETLHHFKFGELPDLLKARRGLHVVRDDQREFLGFRPTGPTGRSFASCRIDGPRCTALLDNRPCPAAPDREPDAPRNIGLDSEIRPRKQPGRTGGHRLKGGNQRPGHCASDGEFDP
jgi:hypothetical protein